MVHDRPYSRRRTTISTFRVVGPPPYPLQLRVRFLVVLPNVVERIVRAELRRPHGRGDHSVKERLGRQSAWLIDGFVEHRARGPLLLGTVPYRCCKATRKCGCASRCWVAATCRTAVLPMQCDLWLEDCCSSEVDWVLDVPLHATGACRNEAAARPSAGAAIA